ncbi:GNAT family N-acetyltransferase [Gelidibacter salicanalis]|uniref:GNAT family N-acetyltransferase n=1 Tax=Gelidibacter salicanalis TaxID=291193 RepID=A0A5C7AN18_9FLAO|nr:GNAT family N-acetyltransferase [Gelidibacter salicanalis]TXE09344.1 GNAT family N-acetyltransferase [Gelidibacter salicanalis]
MPITFKIIEPANINSIMPLMLKLTEHKTSEAVLKQRFAEMVTQNYECAAIFDRDKLIGIAGMWFCTRHYSGRSVELDHVFIEDGYRKKGLGKQFMKIIYDYVTQKGCQAVELNTYVQNYPSHKFYYNEGFEILGYHFLKKI